MFEPHLHKMQFTLRERFTLFIDRYGSVLRDWLTSNQAGLKIHQPKQFIEQGNASKWRRPVTANDLSVRLDSSAAIDKNNSDWNEMNVFYNPR